MDGMATATIAAAGTAAGYAGQRALDFAVDKLAAAIVRPCAERRARAYFQQLAAAVVDADAGDMDSERISAALDAVTKDEPAREAVFEYYRQSVLSRSKETGPRLLALIAARLIQNHRKPTSAEQTIAEIAEVCTDEDLAEFAAYYQSLIDGTMPMHAEHVRKVPAGFLVLLDSAGSESGEASSSVPAGPLSLAAELGRWAAKIEHVGAMQQIIETTTKRQGLYRDEGNGIKGGERHRTEWSVFFSETCRELFRLLPLVTP